MVRTAKLNDGKEIPLIAWGTAIFNHPRTDDADQLGRHAIDSGIPHLDTAQIYRNEKAAGKAVRDSKLPREKVWLTTKLHCNGEPGTTSPESIRKSVQESLDRLEMKPDLLLIHNPFVPEAGKIGEYWQILEGLVNNGTLGGVSLGVSNFRPKDLDEVFKVAKIMPVVNQIELHPYVLTHLQPVLDLSKKHNIVLEAFGPLSPILRHPTGGSLKPILSRMAGDLSKETGIEMDEAGVLLLWLRSNGIVAVTNSTNEERITRIGELEKVRDLSKEEMREIEEVGRKIHFRAYPEHMTKDFSAPDLPEDL